MPEERGERERDVARGAHRLSRRSRIALALTGDELPLRAEVQADARRLREALRRGALDASDVLMAAVWGDLAASAYPDADVPATLPVPLVPDLPGILTAIDESVRLGVPAAAALAAVSASRLALRDPTPVEALYAWWVGPPREPPRVCRCAGRLARLAAETVALLADPSAPRLAVGSAASAAVRAAVEHAGEGVLFEVREEVVRACLRWHERGVTIGWGDRPGSGGG